MRAPEFWQRRGIASTALLPLAWIVRAAGVLRRTLTRPMRAAVPVICVGNLTLGGAGKTPTAIALARHLQDHGIEVHVLLRGYRGRARGPLRVDPARHDAHAVGDEALLLARIAPTWVGADRRKTASLAVAAGARLLLMDDGFQNPGLFKDLSLVVVDLDSAFGNRRLFPAGPLREPIAAGLRRAQALVLVGGPESPAADLTPGGLPVLRARIVPGDAAHALGGRRVYAFAGIGRPRKFFDMLTDIGATVVAARGFADHYAYAPEEIMKMVEEAAALDALPVTTAKDHVRLSADARATVTAVPVALVFEDEGRLEEVLRPVVARAR